MLRRTGYFFTRTAAAASSSVADASAAGEVPSSSSSVKPKPAPYVSRYAVNGLPASANSATAPPLHRDGGRNEPVKRIPLRIIAARAAFQAWQRMMRVCNKYFPGMVDDGRGGR